MKNKKVSLVIVLVVALSLFSVTILAFSGNQDNYEALKKVMMASEHFENGTFNGHLTITDNSKVLLDAKVIGKADHVSENVSGKVILNIEDITKSAEFYKEGQKAYFVDKDNELYYQVDDIEDHKTSHHNRNHFKGKDSREMSKAEEELVDFMMGDIKEQIKLSVDENGTKAFSIDLTENEIPVPIKLLLTKGILDNDHMSKTSDDDEKYEAIHQLPFFNGLEEAHNNFPVITDNVKVNHILISVKIDAEDKIIAHEFSLTVEGTDVSGKAHTTTIDGSLLLNEVNSTVVDTLDLTGKDVKILKK
ncbi:MAG: hypothetical protein CVU84_03525 [Firmicutes bacterium HGW-Firmicutes-1]|jgi:hypothetical protein|nr:MAG: hypothetical protein CVU84_03525 [Firmicutes bacterium HGW-Firmicutes-1]